MSGKQAIIEDLQGAYSELRSAVQGLNDEQALQPFLDGRWAAGDIVAHIVGWNSTVPEFLRRMARGERPVPEGQDYTNADAWNEKFTAEARGRSLSQLLRDLDATEPDFVAAVRALPDDRLEEGKTGYRLVKVATADHMRDHAAQIRQWRQQAGH